MGGLFYPKKWKAKRPRPTYRMNMQKENCPTCFNENISLILNHTFISNVITYVDIRRHKHKYYVFGILRINVLCIKV